MVDTAAVYTGEILCLGQTADQAIMVGKGHCCTHTWVELVVVQDSTCNVDFAVDWCSMMGQRVGLVAGIDFVPVYIEVTIIIIAENIRRRKFLRISRK